MSNYSFNLLTFKMPDEALTVHFSNQELPGTIRAYHDSVPDEVVAHFGEQQHYYLSFDNPLADGLSITMPTIPSFETKVDSNGVEYQKFIPNSCFTKSIIKKYYNSRIHKYFSELGLKVKPNFVSDIEIWIPSTEVTEKYEVYEKYTLKVQFKVVSDKLELLITYAGASKVFKKSIEELGSTLPMYAYNWVLYKNNFYKHEEMPDNLRRDLANVYPVWNFDLRDALNEATIASRTRNRFVKFKSKIEFFIDNFLLDDFQNVIPLESTSLLKVDGHRIGEVSDNSNLLLFGGTGDQKNYHSVPYLGMSKYGPYDLPDARKIHLFFICHVSHRQMAANIKHYFDHGLEGPRYSYGGLLKFAKIQYHAESGFSIVFHDLENPLDEIKRKFTEEARKLDPDVRYIAIYISPFSKEKSTQKQRSVYYRLKEYLLTRGISSQVLDATKVKDNENYVFSLNNISIALLAKLDGEPWRLDRAQKNELVIGVGAYRHRDTEVQYIGSAFSFMNTGSFNQFECFKAHRPELLAGSIEEAIQDFTSFNKGIKRLIIHFYKDMGKEEVKPIEEALARLDLDIPIFIVSINKTESRDFVAFDNDWEELMPLSGKYINIGRNRFLLFNNTRYVAEGKFSAADGFPFPVKLKIECNRPELEKDHRIIKDLLDQVYQFSRMYWKSVRQQNLPVTIKYPEMVAEMFPYFDGKEIPAFGKDKLWFL